MRSGRGDRRGEEARSRLAVGCALALAGCVITPSAHPDPYEHGGEAIGASAAALSDADPVSVAVAASCTTSVVKGLSTQLIDEIQCLRPGTFRSIEGLRGFELGSAVFPWLQAPAREALVAAQERRGATMAIDSALRTLPQQLLLYRWYKAGRCGISLAASPGKSNHEAGLSVDVQDNAAWREAMAAHGFAWFGPSDPVHFDFEGEGRIDIGGLSVLAFQRLWNRNHPDDPIDEDGAYGPVTEERLTRSPVGGFRRGAECAGGDSPSSAGGEGRSPGASEARGDVEEEGGCAIARRPAKSGATSAFGLVIAALLVRAWRRLNIVEGA